MSNNPSQDKTPQEPATQFAQERVTSKELNEALAQIEARKEAEAQRAADTLPLGQAVEELRLGATAEQIFAEVAVGGEGNAQSLAQERVTSEELIRALARIEVRKEEEARRTAGMIPLGQAVEELGLDATPEEIFTEVQNQRRRLVTSLEIRPGSVPPPQSPAGSPLPPDSPPAVTPPSMPELTHCPACSRKLLTKASALCSWCGAKINDPQYQEQAALSRQALDQQERKQVEEVVLEETRYGIYGRLKRRAKQNTGSRNPLG